MNNEIPTNIRAVPTRHRPMRRRIKKPEQKPPQEQQKFERQRPRNPYASNDLHKRLMVEYAPDPLDNHNGNGNEYRHHRPIAYVPEIPQTTKKPHPHRHHDGEFVPVTPKVEELRRPEPLSITTSTVKPTDATTMTTTTSSSSPVQIEKRRLEKLKKLKRNQIKTRLSKLSPEEQREFFRLRKERQMKRRMNNETAPST